jgi:ribosomal protein L37AE/L43A
MFRSKKPPLSVIEQPRCPKCHAKMSLARITPGVPGFEIRSFECPHCEHAIVKRVAADPLLSATGWLSGELKPPR